MKAATLRKELHYMVGVFGASTRVNRIIVVRRVALVDLVGFQRIVGRD
jgi:hypothetical protein